MMILEFLANNWYFFIGVGVIFILLLQTRSNDVQKVEPIEINYETIYFEHNKETLREINTRYKQNYEFYRRRLKYANRASSVGFVICLSVLVYGYFTKDFTEIQYKSAPALVVGLIMQITGYFFMSRLKETEKKIDEGLKELTRHRNLDLTLYNAGNMKDDLLESLYKSKVENLRHGNSTSKIDSAINAYLRGRVDEAIKIEDSP